jgi:hypothetical protein
LPLGLPEDLGLLVNALDTTEVYEPFTNATLVGEAIKPFRKKITLCRMKGLISHFTNIITKYTNPYLS